MRIEKIKKVAEEVFSEKEEIVAAYVYGSFIKNELYEDIDIGILLDENFNPDALYEARLAGEFEHKFKHIFDVRILNERPIRFLFSVLKNSELLYSRNELKRVQFESKVNVEYLDIKPHHELYEKMRRLRYAGR